MAHVREELGAQARGLERQVVRASYLLLCALTQFGRGRALISDDSVAPSQGPLPTTKTKHTATIAVTPPTTISALRPERPRCPRGYQSTMQEALGVPS